MIFFPITLLAGPIYDFWDNSINTNKKNSVKIKNIEIQRPEYIKQNDTIRPSLAKDLDHTQTKLAKDLKETSVKDRYLRYNLKGEKDPLIARDLDPKKARLADDYIKYSDSSSKKQSKKNDGQNTNKASSKTINKAILTNKDIEYKDETLSYKSNNVVFYDENDREESFIDIIPYITIGNSLFQISSGDYSARILDDSISASITFDLGLNYLWENRNIGYLWNINLGDYDFSEKDKTNPNAQSGGEISGYIISFMPTIFYELNRAQKMSVLIGYGVGGSYINLSGNATLANSATQTITNTIDINKLYFSHGLLIEILHDNLMIAFTKVNVTIDEDNQDIKINENRLNIGYKFSF